MAKQWQIRRGTTAENNDFTGAIGEVTMDTTTKGLRVHDGSTQGGIEVPTARTADYVVESQLPTAQNDYTWYRKYRSGWVEQGGEVTTSTPATVSLTVQMENSNYSVMANFVNGTDGAVWVNNRTTTNFQIQGHNANGLATWQVSGMAA